MHHVSDILLGGEHFILGVLLHLPNYLLHPLLRLDDLRQTSHEVLQQVLLVRILFGCDFYLGSVFDGSEGGSWGVVLLLLLLLHLKGTLLLIAALLNLLLRLLAGASLPLDIPQELSE